MKLRNLKASFIMKEKVSVPGKVKSFIFKYDDFTVTLYHHSPTLMNVTGLKCFEQLTLAKKIIEESKSDSKTI